MSRRRPSLPPYLRLIASRGETVARNVIVPLPDGSASARAILAYHSAVLGDSARLVADAAMASVSGVLSEHGLIASGAEEDGTLRATIMAVVAERYRDLVVQRLMEMHGNPGAVAGLTDREALILLLSGPPA